MHKYAYLYKLADAAEADAILSDYAATDAGKKALSSATGSEWLARGVGAAALGGLGYMAGRIINKKNRTLRWLLAAAGAGLGGLGMDYALGHIKPYDGSKYSYKDALRLTNGNQELADKLTAVLTPADSGADTPASGGQTSTGNTSSSWYGTSWAPWVGTGSGLWSFGSRFLNPRVPLKAFVPGAKAAPKVPIGERFKQGLGHGAKTAGVWMLVTALVENTLKNQYGEVIEPRNVFGRMAGK